jgi:hypothetical protein
VLCICNTYFCYTCGEPYATDPCRFEPVKRLNAEIRSTLGSFTWPKLPQESNIKIYLERFQVYLIAFLKLPTILFIIFFGGLLLPVAACLVTLLAALLVSPSWLLFIGTSQTRSPIARSLITATVILMYPLLSVAMTLILLAFIVSYFLFRHDIAQDIYRQIDLCVLHHTVGMLKCIKFLMYV